MSGKLPKPLFGSEPCERKASERKLLHQEEGRDAGLVVVERERKIEYRGLKGQCDPFLVPV